MDRTVAIIIIIILLIAWPRIKSFILQFRAVTLFFSLCPTKPPKVQGTALPKHIYHIAETHDWKKIIICHAFFPRVQHATMLRATETRKSKIKTPGESLHNQGDKKSTPKAYGVKTRADDSYGGIVCRNLSIPKLKHGFKLSREQALRLLKEIFKICHHQKLLLSDWKLGVDI